jgi:hypothetical protein
MKLALPDIYILSRHREQRSCVAIQGLLTKLVFVTLDCLPSPKRSFSFAQAGHGAYAPRNDEVNHSIGYHPALKVSGE